jgi:hypothetical protein
MRDITLILGGSNMHGPGSQLISGIEWGHNWLLAVNAGPLLVVMLVSLQGHPVWTLILIMVDDR